MQKLMYSLDWFQTFDEAEMLYQTLTRRGYTAELIELSEDDAKEFAPFCVSFTCPIEDYLAIVGVNDGTLKDEIMASFKGETNT